LPLAPEDLARLREQRIRNEYQKQINLKKVQDEIKGKQDDIKGKTKMTDEELEQEIDIITEREPTLEEVDELMKQYRDNRAIKRPLKNELRDRLRNLINGMDITFPFLPKNIPKLTGNPEEQLIELSQIYEQLVIFMDAYDEINSNPKNQTDLDSILENKELFNKIRSLSENIIWDKNALLLQDPQLEYDITNFNLFMRGDQYLDDFEEEVDYEGYRIRLREEESERNQEEMDKEVDSEVDNEEIVDLEIDIDLSDLSEDEEKNEAKRARETEEVDLDALEQELQIDRQLSEGNIEFLSDQEELSGTGWYQKRYPTRNLDFRY
jgi:hypothetical protein